MAIAIAYRGADATMLATEDGLGLVLAATAEKEPRDSATARRSRCAIPSRTTRLGQAIHRRQGAGEATHEL
jgi:hypothetical protein